MNPNPIDPDSPEAQKPDVLPYGKLIQLENGNWGAVVFRWDDESRRHKRAETVYENIDKNEAEQGGRPHCANRGIRWLG